MRSNHLSTVMAGLVPAMTPEKWINMTGMRSSYARVSQTHSRKKAPSTAKWLS